MVGIVKYRDWIKDMKVVDEPLVSVVVPVYNVEKKIKKCINSILNQKYHNIEIILVDDGSPDKSGVICDIYKNKYKNITVIHKETGGLSSARNAGIDLAKGEYIGFVDSDDWIDSDMYLNMISNAKKWNAEIVSCKYTFENISNSNKKNGFKIIDGKNKILTEYMANTICGNVTDTSVCTKIFKKDLFDNIRFPDKRLYEDECTVFKLCMNIKRYIKMDAEYYHYIQEGQSIVRSRLNMSQINSVEMNIAEISLLAKKINCPQLDYYVEQYIARNYFSLYAKLIRMGCDDNQYTYIDYEKKIRNKFKKYYRNLMKSKLSINRKVAAMGMLICPSVIKNIYRICNRSAIDNYAK